jgi:alkylation response protein AidB-like acyl-CoA dehydrogenase
MALGAPSRGIQFDFSDEHALLAQNASELLAKRWDFAAVRGGARTELGFDAALHRELCDLGWLGLCVPAELGGSGMPVSALPCIFEPIGQRLLAGPYFANTLATQALLCAASPAQQRAVLPALASGAELATVAVYEPDGSYLLEQPGVSAKAAAQGFELAGHKTSVLDTAVANHVLVSASLGGELAWFWVPAAALRGRISREVSIDETRRTARIDFTGLTLPAAALLEGDARRALQHVQQVAWLLSAAEMSGGTEGVLALTLDYLRTRTQFGKPIGSYQALKHPMAEIMCSLEEGRSLLYRAAASFSFGSADAEVDLRMAKAQLGETYAYAADRSIQFHGAIGFTYECHAQLFFRRAQWLEHSFGDAPHHRRKLADLLYPRS